MKKSTNAKTRSKPAQVAGAKPGIKKINSSSGPHTWMAVLPIVLLLVITWFLYQPALKFEFTNWDDPTYVLENPQVKQFNGETVSYFCANPSASNYHPLTMISLGIDYQYAARGLKITSTQPDVPAGRFHKTNIILHLINVVLVFIFVFLVTGRRIIAATVTSMLFAIHPMHVESVAWIAERKDVLYTMFFMAGLITYLRYQDKKSILWYLVVLLLYIGSLLSKPAAVVFPLVLLALDYFRDRRLTARVWLEKTPFFILSIVFGVITVMIQSKDAIADIEVFTWYQRLMFAAYGFIMYLYSLIAPVKLSAFYPYPALTPSGGLPAIYYFSPFIALAITGLVVFSLRFTKVILFGFLFYLVSLLLVLQFISVGSAIMADRYSYVASIGLFFIIAWYVDQGFARKSGPLHSLRWVIAGVVLIFSVLLVNVAWSQVKVWENTETLWTDVISKFPRAEVAYKNRGNYYGKLNQTDKALADYNIYVQLKKDDPRAFSNLGNIYGLRNEIDKALEAYSKSIEFDSANHETYLNRAITFAKAKKFEQALKDYDKSLLLKPGTQEIYMNRAYTLLEAGKYEESVSDFTFLTGLFPANDDYYLRRGNCYYMLKKYKEALDDFLKCLEVNPANGSAAFNASVLYNMEGNYPKAYQFALKAQTLKYPVDSAYLDGLKKKQ